MFCGLAGTSSAKGSVGAAAVTSAEAAVDHNGDLPPAAAAPAATKAKVKRKPRAKAAAAPAKAKAEAGVKKEAAEGEEASGEEKDAMKVEGAAPNGAADNEDVEMKVKGYGVGVC